MRGNININSNSNNNANNSINNKNADTKSVSSLEDSINLRTNTNDADKIDDSIMNISNNNDNTNNNVNNNNNNNTNNNLCNNDRMKKNNNNGNQSFMKKNSSVESIGFIEVELREAYNNPGLIQELNLNMIIPKLTLAMLQTAITTTNGLTTLCHNSLNSNKNNNSSNLTNINQGKGIMDINDSTGRCNNDDQPFYSEVDELLHDLPDSSDMYKDIELRNDEKIGFKDLKNLDLYISGLAKNLRADDINKNFIITDNEILSRYSNDNINDNKLSIHDSSKKEKVLRSGGSNNSLLKLKKSYESKNVEFCKFSGYITNMVTPLPNNVSASDVINKMLTNFKYKYQRKWRIYLNYKENIDIICDIFWLSYISWYKCHRKNEFNAMYSRLSYNYVKFINKLYDTDKNEFLVSYPLIMAHLNYLIYCECFPNSIGDFDCESFKKRDCELIYKWFVGDTPFEEVWLKWRSVNSKYLIDTTEKRKKTSFSKRNNKMYDTIYQTDNNMEKSFLNDINNELKKNKTKSTNQTSLLYTTDLKTQRVQKNINSNSPIVSYYINNIGYDSCKLPYVVQSYEVTRVPKDPNKESYQQIIENSMKRTNKDLKNYLKNKDDIIKEKNRGNQETIFCMRKFDKMTQKILTKPQQVKELCDIICEELYSNKFTKGKKHLPKIKLEKNKNINIDESLFK
jgi:hypothetical protein